jgi:hypothetical protein
MITKVFCTLCGTKIFAIMKDRISGRILGHHEAALQWRQMQYVNGEPAVIREAARLR